MGGCVDLEERVTAQFYDEECEEWTMRTVTIEDVLDSVCDDYTVLPSAQPERKKGKWISTDDGWDGEYFVCSACGCTWTLIDGSPEDNGMNFCPNCGAYMRGKQNG